MLSCYSDALLSCLARGLLLAATVTWESYVWYTSIIKYITPPLPLCCSPPVFNQSLLQNNYNNTLRP